MEPPSYGEIFDDNINIIKQSKSSTPFEDERSLHESDEKELTNRGNLYTQILSAYVIDFNIRHKRNRRYKTIYFYTITSVFVLTVVLSAAAMAVILKDDVTTTNDLVLAFSALSTLISAIIVLPKIIAHYLFHPDEDNKVTDMVKAMQDNDSTTRKIYNRIDVR